MFTVCGSSEERLLFTMLPAELNSLSQDTDVAGTQPCQSRKTVFIRLPPHQGRRKLLEIGGVSSVGSLVVLQRVGAFDEHLT